MGYGLKRLLLLVLLVALAACTSSKYKEAAESGDIVRLQQFVEDHPESKYAARAQALIQEIRFDRAAQENTEEAWRAFLQDFPGSTREAEVRARLEELIFARYRQLDTYEGWAEYLGETHPAAYAEKARERLGALNFERVKAARDPDQWSAFLREFPESKLREQALDELFAVVGEMARQTGEPERLERLAEEFPGGERATQATRQALEIRYQKELKRNTAEGWREFIRAHPGTPQAARAEQRLEELKKKDARKALEEGEALFARGRYREALARLRGALEIDPGLKDVEAKIEDCLFRLGNYEELARRYEKKHPGKKEAYNRLALKFERLGRPLKAVRAYEEALRAAGRDEKLERRIAEIYARAGNEGEALRLLRANLLRNPFDADIISRIEALKIGEAKILAAQWRSGNIPHGGGYIPFLRPGATRTVHRRAPLEKTTLRRLAFQVKAHPWVSVDRLNLRVGKLGPNDPVNVEKYDEARVVFTIKVPPGTEAGVYDLVLRFWLVESTEADAPLPERRADIEIKETVRVYEGTGGKK